MCVDMIKNKSYTRRPVGRPTTKTTRKQFLFAADTDKILCGVAQSTKRTQTSIIEQLVRQFCTTKNLA